MDYHNVEKAIITTINRTKYYKKREEAAANLVEEDNTNKFMDNFKKLMQDGQLDHTDVKDLAKRAPERFYKFFWFNPNMNSEEEEKDYHILEDHFKEGFCGVKIHSGFHMINIPKDIKKLVSFMQEFDKNLILYIHSLPKTSFFNGMFLKMGVITVGPVTIISAEKRKEIFQLKPKT